MPECQTHRDCPDTAKCGTDQLGVKKCVDICESFTCVRFAVCQASNHRGACKCLPGYSGNPGDRSGCRPISRDECTTDAQCPEVDVCQTQGNVRKCVSVCNTVQCATGAVCVAKNHIGQCQCPPGLFAGDANGKGCQSVGCLTDEDCSYDKACNRMDHQCFDVCYDACGENAVCIAENHRYNCQCAPGYKPNGSAEIGCNRMSVCDSNPCHATANCVPNGATHLCTCPRSKIGDPYTTGCHRKGMCPQGTDDDCPADSVCKNGYCKSPCENYCGPNAICNVVNRKPQCNCLQGFEQSLSNSKGCSRITNKCTSDTQCRGDICIQGQCMEVCRRDTQCAQGEKCINNRCVSLCLSSEQCSKDLSCIDGVCLIGCRSNSDCATEEACVNNKCTDPCLDKDVCGPNAECKLRGHVAECLCPEGFQKVQRGCIRITKSCENNDDCINGHKCENNQCKPVCDKNNDCAQGEHCNDGKCVKVCFNDGNCLQREVCVEGSCQGGCRNSGDCSQNEVCVSQECMCSKGFIPGVAGCVDVDECSDDPCHSTATCINLLGSYKCSCPYGTVGDPKDGGCVKPSECDSDSDCKEDGQICHKNGGSHNKCMDPCSSSVCGPNSKCEVEERQPVCVCQDGYFGNPNNLSNGCVKAECINDNDCSSNRMCHTPSYRCINPCENINCAYGRCQAVDHKAVCQCKEGFHMAKDGTCVDTNECQLENPCHRTAVCRNSIGSFSCTCTSGLIGDPQGDQGCRRPGDCVNDGQCPASSVCDKNRCRNPCDLQTCGSGAVCRVVGRQPVCSCPVRTTGDPLIHCTELECVSFPECTSAQSCIDNRCVDPCTVPGVCGQNTECVARRHRHRCSCKAGYTGDANFGCSLISYCKTEDQCPSGQQCNGGRCVPGCTTTRECLSGQVCIQGSCTPTCRTNRQCPEYQVCSNNMCAPEQKCRSNDECSNDQTCRQNPVGVAECLKVCDNTYLCGKGANCVSDNHTPMCQCPEGTFGDPLDERIGCQPIECQANSNCKSNEVCNNYKCQDACSVKNQCGSNARCQSVGHNAVCFCRDGYSGDPIKGCQHINYCADNPCGAKARCSNARGTYKCACPPGTVGDPTAPEGCRLPDECSSDSDCPDSAFCGTDQLRRAKCKNACEADKVS